MLAPRATKALPDVSREQIASLERELEATQHRNRTVEETYGIDNLCLTVAMTYLGKLLGRPAIVRWLTHHRGDYLTEFRNIVDSGSLNPAKAKSA